MDSHDRLSADAIRTMFSQAMSDMYRDEVPQYGTLLDLVAEANAASLSADPRLAEDLRRADEIERLDLERHGAIRLGKPEELRIIGRVFSVMGMHPVGYYDLGAAGVPVHATAFRPIDDASLRRNPFRVFTSLLRLELIEDASLRVEAVRILERRQIFTPALLELLSAHDWQGGLTAAQANRFVGEALEIFRWHSTATVSSETYRAMHNANRLLADVVCFRGPHINHLTPRTLDIDHVQAAMPSRGIEPKATIEGPPRRNCPILLRQTSFKALEEPILFNRADGTPAPGSHTARFGEIEQRGVALTRKGRALYDHLLAQGMAAARGKNGETYRRILEEAFETFPDDHGTLRREKLAFYRYSPTRHGEVDENDIEALVSTGALRADPIVYEDFLPVSAAGIFQSNLDSALVRSSFSNGSQTAFEAALDAPVQDEMELYNEAEQTSLNESLRALGIP